MKTNRRDLAATLLVLQAVGMLLLGVGLLDLLHGQFATAAISGNALRTFLGIVGALVLAASAVGFATGSRAGVSAASGAALVIEFVAGCSSAVDALAGRSGLNRWYLLAFAVAAAVVGWVACCELDAIHTPRQPLPPDHDAPLVRAGLRGFLQLQRRDVALCTGLIVLAFLIRFVSPVFLPVLDHPLGGPSVAAWGVGYPYNATGCNDVPVPPAKAVAAPASGTPSSTQTEIAGQTLTTSSQCGFVFDEVYFPVDASKDLHQPAVSYFDPEPPLAKLLMAPPLAAFGFNTWSWRLSTTIFGSLLAGLMYLIAMRLRRDRFFATMTGLIVCLDGLALVESRTGVIDIIAIFFVALLYYAFLLHWQARTKRQWRVTLYLMAAVCGLAFAAKLTAIAPTVLIVALILMRYLEVPLLRWRPWLSRLTTRRDIGPALWRQAGGRNAWVHYGVAALLIGTIFCFTWARYLTVTHDDVYHFTACDVHTIGLTSTTETIHPPLMHVGGLSVLDPKQALYNIYTTMQAGLQYHTQECHGHPYASHWFSWPVMQHPVLFYYAGDQIDPNNLAVVNIVFGKLFGAQVQPTVASITDMGNPAIWWMGALAMLFCVWRMLTGPLWLRLGTIALGTVSLGAMMLLFFMGQQPDDVTVRVTVDGRFLLAMAGMAGFGLLATVQAVIARRFLPAFIVMGYELAWLMWAPGNERRVLFFYHALGLFLLTSLALAYALAAFRQQSLRWRGRTFSLAPVAYALVAVIVAAFVFFYPVWTAQPLPAADHGMRIWVDTW